MKIKTFNWGNFRFSFVKNENIRYIPYATCGTVLCPSIGFKKFLAIYLEWFKRGIMFEIPVKK